MTNRDVKRNNELEFELSAVSAPVYFARWECNRKVGHGDPQEAHLSDYVRKFNSRWWPLADSASATGRNAESAPYWPEEP